MIDIFEWLVSEGTPANIELCALHEQYRDAKDAGLEECPYDIVLWEADVVPWLTEKELDHLYWDETPTWKTMGENLHFILGNRFLSIQGYITVAFRKKDQNNA